MATCAVARRIPFELRLLLARDPKALSAVGRICVQEIARWQREQADPAGGPGRAASLGIGEIGDTRRKQE